MERGDRVAFASWRLGRETQIGAEFEHGIGSRHSLPGSHRNLVDRAGWVWEVFQGLPWAIPYSYRNAARTLVGPDATGKRVPDGTRCAAQNPLGCGVEFEHIDASRGVGAISDGTSNEVAARPGKVAHASY